MGEPSDRIPVIRGGKESRKLLNVKGQIVCVLLSDQLSGISR